jgi:hypothetical protein
VGAMIPRRVATPRSASAFIHSPRPSRDAAVTRTG